MKMKFIVLDKAEEEAKWLQQFLEDIPLWSKPISAICIHCNNQATIFTIQNFVYNDKSKHICRRHNILRQLLSNRVIFIDFVVSKYN